MIIFILLAALWLVLWRQLSGEWSVNDQYSYGWFVPIFALFLLWQRWEDAPKAESVEARVPTRITGSLAAEDSRRYTKTAEGSSRFQVSDFRFRISVAIAIGIAALLLLLPIRLFEIANPDWRPLSWLHAAIVVTLTLLVIWYAGGTPWVRHLAFPILFVFVAVPWITPIEVPIVQGLMRLVAAIASEAVSLFGIPARLEGNLIRINNGLVGVNEACSGVRSLQTSLMIGLLFGELKRLSIWQRVALVAAAVGIAFLGNCVRAFSLVWIAATKNIAAVDRWHDLAGYSIVAAVFIGSLLLARLFGRNKIDSAAGVEARVPTRITDNVAAEDSRNYTKTSEVSGQSIVLISALIWIALVEIAVATWYRAHERNLVATARWEVQWPQGEQNFHELKIDETVQRILRFDHGQAAAWTWPGFATLDLATSFTARPPICSLFFFRWNPGKNSALLATLHRPDVCLPAVGWEQVADTGVKNYPVAAGFALPFRHFEFRHAVRDNTVQQVAHAFYCLWEDRAPAAQRLQIAPSASAWTRGERVRAVLEGRRHLGQQVLEFVIQTRGPIEPDQAEARFGEALPQLIAVRRD